LLTFFPGCPALLVIMGKTWPAPKRDARFFCPTS
jgi:hypothetical protein